METATIAKRSYDISYKPVGHFEETRFEKIHNIIFESSSQASIIVAQEIASLIRKKQQQGLPCVLGLATGSSPIRVYEELVRMHKEEGLSFFNVITFNLEKTKPFFFMHSNKGLVFSM